MRAKTEKEIRAYYGALFRAWGPQHWWPAESAFEVVVGAYLTQNTAWINVEKALANLRTAGVLSVRGIRTVSVIELEDLIRPAGYFRQKAKRLKLFVRFLDDRYGGSLARMFATPTNELRQELISLNGVGPETADSILLYAGNHSVFVVDAYTRRVVERHELLPEGATYEEIQRLFQEALFSVANSDLFLEGIPEGAEFTAATGFPGTRHPPSKMSTVKRTALAQTYNEMHGLIVGVGKHYCRKSQARCDECPLRSFLPAHK
ncbi:MAG: base excision DNA repair protein [Candidatus Sulfotelmatobacter sp.]